MKGVYTSRGCYQSSKRTAAKNLCKGCSAQTDICATVSSQAAAHLSAFVHCSASLLQSTPCLTHTKRTSCCEQHMCKGSMHSYSTMFVMHRVHLTSVVSEASQHEAPCVLLTCTYLCMYLPMGACVPSFLPHFGPHYSTHCLHIARNIHLQFHMLAMQLSIMCCFVANRDPLKKAPEQMPGEQPTRRGDEQTQPQPGEASASTATFEEEQEARAEAIE